MKHFERISEYLDGELDPATCIEIERHMAECPQCENCVESLKRTVALCRKMGGEKLAPDEATRIREKLRECLFREHKAG
jgi:RNA polymerase sigma-70 factor (ECF subfamily)